jgi:NADH:ubiquinone oxidoreductase subunit 6 (subunit J)
MLLGDTSTESPLNWVVLFPVVTGFLAVWYLLPSPRRRPLVNGVLAVVVAILGFGTFLFHGFSGDLPFSTEVFLFASFSLMAFTFGILMIVQRNPARAALFFAVVVLSVCGLFLLLAAPFLMAATTIIYAGAIIVTFLFVIMLSQQRGPSDANDRCREPSLAAAVGFVILGALLVVLQRVYLTSELDELLRQTAHHAESNTLDDRLKNRTRARHFIAELVRVRERFGYGKLEIPTVVDGQKRLDKDSDPVEDLRETLELNPLWEAPAAEGGSEPKINVEDVKKWSAQIHYELSYLKAVREGRIVPEKVKTAKLSPYGQVKPAPLTDDPDKAALRQLPSANIAAIGRVLFADHLLAVELGGTLLLIATIGAIAIAGSRPEKAV